MNNSFSSKKLVSSRYTQGYVYVPYIMVQNISIEYQLKLLKRLRVEKLNKLNNI
jgi:hypothetical protein